MPGYRPDLRELAQISQLRSRILIDGADLQMRRAGARLPAPTPRTQHCMALTNPSCFFLAPSSLSFDSFGRDLARSLICETLICQTLICQTKTPATGPTMEV